MKIFHTSDWHLGRMLYGRNLIEDQEYFIKHVFLPAVSEEKPDLILISGDVYDRQIAPVEAILLFDETISKLAEMEIETAFTAGNHDGSERIAIAKKVLKKSGIYASVSLGDAFEPIEFVKNGEKIQLFLLPYADTAEVRQYFKDETLRGETACMRRIVEEMQGKMKEEYTKILSAHCFVAGSSISESESTMFVGGSGDVSSEIFQDFDYVALGHLHGAQKAGQNGRYSGSPLKYSVDEESHKKSFVVLEIQNGEINHRLFPVEPLRDVRRLEGVFEDILKSGEENGVCGDYVEIILKDEKPIMLAADRLRPFYPQMLAVRNSWISENAVGERGARLQAADEMTMFAAFMSEICGSEITEEEKAWFSEVLKESV
jgi:exonuclease SbcD